MTLFAFTICQPADREKIRRLEEPDAVLKIETVTAIELSLDVSETGGPKAGQRGQLDNQIHDLTRRQKSEP